MKMAGLRSVIPTKLGILSSAKLLLIGSAPSKAEFPKLETTLLLSSHFRHQNGCFKRIFGPFFYNKAIQFNALAWSDPKSTAIIWL